jgi:hypothetical protein
VLPKLQENASPAHAVELLRDAARRARNVVGAGYKAADLLVMYQEWAADSERALSSVLIPSELSRLLLTQRYWAARGALAFSGLTTELQTELQARQAQLDLAADEVEAEIRAWAYSGPGFPARRRHALVLDTNILEQHAGELGAYPWSERAQLTEGAITLVIPSVVRDELDRHKLSDNRPRINGVQVELRKQASDALRIIADLFPGADDRAELQTSSKHPSNVYLPVDELTRSRLPIADNEIVADALELLPYAESVTLVSYDTNICLTAARYGLQTLHLRYSELKNREDSG